MRLRPKRTKLTNLGMRVLYHTSVYIPLNSDQSPNFTIKMMPNYAMYIIKVRNHIMASDEVEALAASHVRQRVSDMVFDPVWDRVHNLIANSIKEHVRATFPVTTP